MSIVDNKHADLSPQVDAPAEALSGTTTVFYTVVNHIACLCNCAPPLFGLSQSDPNPTNQNNQTERPKSWFHPSRPFYQYSILFLAAYLLVAGYFADEAIGATTTALKEEMGLSTTQVGWLYSSGFGPTVLTIFISGFVIDKFGVRITSLVFSSLVLIGILVFAFSNGFWGKLVGRMIFGMGFEPLEVCQDAILVRWFSGTKSSGPSLPLAFSIAFSMSILGQFVGLNLIPALLSHFGDLKKVYYTVALLCISGWVANVVFNLMDLVAAPDLHLDDDTEHDVISPLSLKDFPTPYWILLLISFFGYSCQYVFMIYASDYLHEKWGYTALNSSRLASLVYAFGFVLSPAIGFFIERKGYATSFMGSGIILFAVASVMMAIMPLELSPIFPLIMMGFAYAAVPASIWSAIATVIPEHLAGTGYGTMTAVISLSLVIIPYLVGRIRDTLGSYEMMNFVFAACGFISFVGILILCRYTDQSVLFDSRTTPQPADELKLQIV